jgi:hypothetical protein
VKELIIECIYLLPLLSENYGWEFKLDIERSINISGIIGCQLCTLEMLLGSFLSFCEITDYTKVHNLWMTPSSKSPQ